MTIIRGHQFTTFEVAPDGESVSLNVLDERAQPASLVLPSECLNALLMTLPDIVRRTLTLRFRDRSMRVVYPVAKWEVERSPSPGNVVMTLRTPDGFAMSFSMPTLALLGMATRSAAISSESTGVVNS